MLLGGGNRYNEFQVGYGILFPEIFSVEIMADMVTYPPLLQLGWLQLISQTFIEIAGSCFATSLGYHGLRVLEWFAWYQERGSLDIASYHP